MLDADEEPSHWLLGELPGLVTNTRADGYFLRLHNLVSGQPSCDLYIDKYRLFRRDHVVYFGGIHTTCDPEEGSRVVRHTHEIGIHHYKVESEQELDNRRYAAGADAGHRFGDTSLVLRPREFRRC